LSTGSAINATLYGASRISYIIARDGELPKVLENDVWKRPVEGLIITTILTLLMANLLNLHSISTMGSSGFLIIFAAVNYCNFKLSKKTGSVKWLPLLGVIVCLFALGALLWQTWITSPWNVLVLVIMVGISFLIEVTYRKITGREIKSNMRVKKVEEESPEVKKDNPG